MIVLDASVVVKWFKPQERFAAEAQWLLEQIGAFRIEAAASEWLSLEVVRGLKRAQQELPEGAILDDDIHAAYNALESLFRSGALLEIPVSEVKMLTKNAEIALGLYAADALHLATAIYLGARWLVTDDHHLLTDRVRHYAMDAGVRVVTLPEARSLLAPEIR